MTDDDFKIWLRRLPDLTKEQATDTRRRLLALINNKESGGVGNRDWIMDGILTVLKERGVGHMIPPNFRVRKTNSFAGYETQADRVRQLLSNAVPNMSVTEEKSIGVIVSRALADYISSWSEITFDSMLRNVSKIPEALDVAFPGYLDSGMFSFIIRNRR